jgi:hypothetical protein
MQGGAEKYREKTPQHCRRSLAAGRVVYRTRRSGRMLLPVATLKRLAAEIVRAYIVFQYKNA